MNKHAVWGALVLAVIAAAGCAEKPAAELPPTELDFVDPFAAPAASPPTAKPVAEAIDRATAEQHRANVAAEREARRDRYGY